MPSHVNDNDLNLLDSAARTFMEQAKVGSRFYSLMNTTAPLLATVSVAPDNSSPANKINAGSAEKGGINLAFTERLSRSVEWNLPQVGDMPPQPPTFRGRAGAVLVRIVRRALFWYTGQIRTFHAQVAEAAREQVLAFQGLGAQQRHDAALMGELRKRIAELERQTEVNQAAIASSLAAMEAQEPWRDQFHQLDQAVKSLEQARVDFEQRNVRRMGEIDAALQAQREKENLQRSALIAKVAQIDAAFADTRQTQVTFEEDLRQNFKAEFKEIRQQVHEAKTHLLRQELRLKMLVRELRKHAVTPGDAAAVLADEVAHIHDPLFVDHAASFRGSRADIKNRLTVYLPYVQEAFAAAMRSPALDLACGRGEWMELLAEAGIPAKGVDSNRELVTAGRDLGLDMIQGDLFQFLQTVPDESRSMVTAFHILEHVPFPDMVDLIDQAVRILKPGGIVIFETPNPKNLFVSSNNFYLDPTHLHPIPSEFLAFLVEARGLCDPKVLPFSPYPDYFHLPESDCPAVTFINSHFYGAQDYAVIAQKM
jgi:2-polyprenyl-3-methyl-5-hydroxy-6-metoxy-1,4-benzoquinol methylase